MKSETDSLADSSFCLGCGHEHNCGMYGCAVIREAIDRISIAEWIPETLELPPGRPGNIRADAQQKRIAKCGQRLLVT